MNNKLGIQDLASAFSERYGMDVKSSQAFVKAVFDIVEEYVATDKLVKIKGFGTFKLINVSDRESINVNTGERIVIAGHTKLSFTPDNALKEAVNRPFSDFETTVLNENTSTEAMEKLPAQSEDVSSEDITEDNAGEQDLVVAEEALSDEHTPTEVPVVTEEQSVVTVVVDAEKETAMLNEVEESVEERLAEGDTPEVQPEAAEPVIVQPKESATHTHKPNDDNPSYPMSEEPIVEPVSVKAGKSRSWVYLLVCLMLMAVSYVCGHYRLLDKVEVVLYSESDEAMSDTAPQQVQDSEVVVEPLSADENAECDTLCKDTVLVADETQPTSPKADEDPAEIAKYFPQVPGGEYWIVGDAGYVHHMQVGETLYRIARKELGDQNLVRYLIVFNKFEDPNIIHTGDPIRIPKLLKKVQTETIQEKSE